MLDLGFSQESNGRFLTGSPEAGGRKTKRVEARYKRIELLSKSTEVSKGLHLQGRRGRNPGVNGYSIEGRSGECCSSRCKNGGDSELHVGQVDGVLYVIDF